MIPYPKEIYLETSTICQFACIFCLNPRLPSRQTLSFEKIKTIIEKFENGTLIDLTGYGEFLMYPEFESLVSFLTEKKIKFTFNTNGQALNKRKQDILRSSTLSSINFSLNTLNNKLHYYFSGEKSNLDNILTNIIQFVKKPRDFETSVSMVVNSQNFLEMTNFVKFASNNEIENVRFIPLAQNVEYPENFNSPDNIEVVKSLQKATLLAGKLGVHPYGIDPNAWSSVLKKAPITTCTVPWRMIIIGVQGNIAACCNLPNYSLGNINEKSFEEIWNGEKATKLREAIKTGNNSICKNCPEFE